MSCSKYRWTPDCDGDFCPGDCDLCNKNSEPTIYDGELTDEESVW